MIYLWTVIACLVAVAHGVEGAAFTAAPFYAPGQFELLAVMAGLSIAVFNFGGPEMLTTLGEETRGGAKTLGIGVLVAFAALGSLYLLLVYVAALVWPDYTTLGDPDTAFYEIAARAGGPALKSAFVLAVVIATFGSCIGAQACSSRLLYAMGRDRMFPKVLSRVHPKYQSPYIGVVAIGVTSTILCLAFPDRAEVMTEMVNFSLLLCWSAVNVTAIGYFMLKQRSRNYLRDLACPILGVAGHRVCVLQPGLRSHEGWPRLAGPRGPVRRLAQVRPQGRPVVRVGFRDLNEPHNSPADGSAVRYRLVG